jgi:adenylate kinase
MVNTSPSQEQIAIIKTWLGSGSINIFGLPYAGKDTHGSTLAELLGAPLLSGGDILRNSAIPPEVKKDLDAGILVPTDDYLRIVTPYLKKPEFEGKPLILSSVGRWIGEEDGVIAATETSGHPIKAVVYLHLSEHTMKKRWAKSQEKDDRGNRADDAEHVIDTRIQEFYAKTLPVVEVYRQQGLLIEVNSDADKDEVLKNILSRLFSRASA